MLKFGTIALLVLPIAFGQTSPSLRSYTKSPSAKKRIPTPIGEFTLWVDQTKWAQEKPDLPGELKFSSLNGTGWVKVVTDPLGLPTDGIRDLVLLDKRSVDPGAKITLEEKRIVNGQEILALQTVGVNKGVPFKHFGYYYGGASGTIQVIAYSIEAALNDNIDLFTDFLNGLEISDQGLIPTDSHPMAKTRLVSFNSNMGLKYDPKKWKQMPSKQEGHFYFSYALGDGYAVISPDPLPIPTDTFPEIALASAKSTDPNAAIVFLEKRRVAGVEVYFVKTKTSLNKRPVIYCGYYYGGEHNSVQILTYTTTDLLSKYERDFMEFLNGFTVSNEE